MKLAIVGATGIVGREMLKLLEERDFPVTELILVASEKSYGETILFRKRKHKIISLQKLIDNPPKLALFSAGREISKVWAPKLAENDCKVIDNSSYWRMCSNHKLIVPEINGSQIEKSDMIIANPNCSTIQLVMALAPLHNKYTVKRVVISTYQAITGTGTKAVKQMENEKQNFKGEMVYPHQIYNNVLPHIDFFEKNGYTKEEMKITNETKKILDEKINITATAVRVPILVVHSESVNITFKNDFDLDSVRDLLQNTNGVKVIDDPKNNKYPMPINAKGKDDIFVGRIRRDFSLDNTLNMWVVSDNLRKGAATNTIQIAEYLIKKNLI